jgi:hypothetical protein
MVEGPVTLSVTASSLHATLFKLAAASHQTVELRTFAGTKAVFCLVLLGK